MIHFFPMTGRAPCEECGGPCGVTLDVGTTGYSVGDDYQHTAECSTTKCKHGVPWADECDKCEEMPDMGGEAEDDEPADDPYK